MMAQSDMCRYCETRAILFWNKFLPEKRIVHNNRKSVAVALDNLLVPCQNLLISTQNLRFMVHGLIHCTLL